MMHMRTQTQEYPILKLFDQEDMTMANLDEELNMNFLVSLDSNAIFLPPFTKNFFDFTISILKFSKELYFPYTTRIGIEFVVSIRTKVPKIKMFL